MVVSGIGWIVLARSNISVSTNVSELCSADSVCSISYFRLRKAKRLDPRVFIAITMEDRRVMSAQDNIRSFAADSPDRNSPELKRIMRSKLKKKRKHEE